MSDSIAELNFSGLDFIAKLLDHICGIKKILYGNSTNCGHPAMGVHSIHADRPDRYLLSMGHEWKNGESLYFSDLEDLLKEIIEMYNFYDAKLIERQELFSGNDKIREECKKLIESLPKEAPQL